MIHIHALVYFSKVLLKGLPQLFVTFISVLLMKQKIVQALQIKCE